MVIKENTEQAVLFRKKMLDWYDRCKRDLPWRQTSDPYHIWISEVMLQQTQVKTVIPYYLKFVTTWPDVFCFASADREDVMAAWAGLGYYSRARNMHACANAVVNEFDGVFPNELKDLQRLPGIGDYTSAAIRSIAFDKPAVVCDGNVERIMARYHAEGGDKRALKGRAALYADGFENRPGDYAQALMDLGATICRPKSPLCSACPIQEDCCAYSQGTIEQYPVKAKKKKIPRRFGYVYVVRNEKGEILLEKRAEQGLLAGLYGLPTSQWVDKGQSCSHLALLESYEMNKTDYTCKHIFTHFHLELEVFEIALQDASLPTSENYIWLKFKQISDIGLPRVFEKVIALVFS